MSSEDRDAVEGECSSRDRLYSNTTTSLPCSFSNTRLAMSSRWEVSDTKFRLSVGTVSTGQRLKPCAQVSYSSLSCVRYSPAIFCS